MSLFSWFAKREKTPSRKEEDQEKITQNIFAVQRQKRSRS